MTQENFEVQEPDDESPLAAITDVQSVGGFPVVVARPKADGTGNAGTVIQTVFLRDDDGDTFSTFSVTLHDLAFIVHSLAKQIEDNSRLVAGFGNFDLVASEKNYNQLQEYIRLALASLAASAAAISKTGFCSEADLEQ